VAPFCRRRREFMTQPAKTPAPPYFAVIFTAIRSPSDSDGYEATSQRMLELAQEQPGYLGVESVRGEDGLGITVSYWSSLEAIRAWREHAEHRLAQEQGRTAWYSRYALRVCRVERAWEFEAESNS
jgi:heme-degrading monooxygenase HmoA